MSWLPVELPQRVGVVGGLEFVPLTPALVEPDYTAVMRDIPMLRAWSGEDWPTVDFPIEENLADLERHHREQMERVALTYSVLVDGRVLGCIYVLPLPQSLGGRGITVPAGLELPAADVVVRGWMHERPAAELIGASTWWLGREPFTFPRVWWQTNSQCPDQLAACDALGLTDVIELPGSDRTWYLRAAPADPLRFHVEHPGSADAQFCLGRYFDELGRRFDGGFDPSLSNAPDADVFSAPTGLFVVARLRGEPVGCGALRFHRDHSAEIKRMWVADSARGVGLGRRLLTELERLAAERGNAVVRLETNRSLAEAIALYRSAGYVEVDPFNDEHFAHHWFEKRL
ncbi:MAG: GNAT family N-acetyltransferase [Actinomycetota bacterium]|nr:GNAT family N-acetyltransferase [Actinomycetota bacterium]